MFYYFYFIFTNFICISKKNQTSADALPCHTVRRMCPFSRSAPDWLRSSYRRRPGWCGCWHRRTGQSSDPVSCFRTPAMLRCRVLVFEVLLFS